MKKTNKFFDLHQLKESEPAPKEFGSGSLPVYLNHHLDRIANVDELVRMPAVGEVFFLQTEKAFNAFTFIPWISKRLFIDELYASTYSISRRVIESLQHLQHNGRIGKVTLLISDSMIKRNPVTIDVLEAVIKHNANFQVKYYWNHSKVCLIKAGDSHLILEGSGNWSENAQLEQYIITNHEEVYNFRRKIFEL